MKKIFFILMTGLMLLVMSGCGMKEIQNNKAQKLSAEEKAILDLTENGSAKTRSINEICVQEEPLVMRENVYNESGVLVQYFQYEYDELNRLIKKTTYHKSKSDSSEFDERKNTIEYVYEILQDDVVVNDAEVTEGDDV